MSKNKEEQLNANESDKAAAEQNLDAGKATPDTEVKDELTLLRENLAEINDKYLRLYSEFDNFKRRTAKERIDLLQGASKEVVLAMIPVLDDFERAERSIQASQDLEALKEGVKLVHHKFRSILTQQGLQPMDSLGKEFDVDFHEAITKVPAPSKDMKGKVVDEVEKGYLLKDKVIRFAKVVVGE